MRAFQFSLQAILTLREEKEQEAQRAVASALNLVAMIQSRIAAVVRELDGLGTEVRGRLGHGVMVRELEQLGNYQTVLSERRLRLEVELARAEQGVEQARTVLLKATQDRQALENYRVRLHRMHDYQQARAEQKMLDDLAGRSTGLGAEWRTSPGSPAS